MESRARAFKASGGNHARPGSAAVPIHDLTHSMEESLTEEKGGVTKTSVVSFAMRKEEAFREKSRPTDCISNLAQLFVFDF